MISLTDSEIYLYKLNEKSVSDFELLPVSFGEVGREIEIGKIYPNFAKEVHPVTVNDASSPFSIRTPQQMMNISHLANVDLTGVVFDQERDLDFTDIKIDTKTVVNGIFAGIYDGRGHLISNTAIESSDVNVGLFSQNGVTGVIKNLTVFFDSKTSGIYGTAPGANVGIITGSNNGIISDITVVSTIVDTGTPGVPMPPIAVSPICGFIPEDDDDDRLSAKVGGITGINSETGRINNIMYLAPAPDDGEFIYPIVFDNQAREDYINNVYFLKNEIISDGTAIDGFGNFQRVELIDGYNSMELHKNENGIVVGIGEGRNTRDLITLDLFNDNWKPGLQDLINDPSSLTNEYPYQYINSIPPQWPLVGKPFVPDLTIPAPGPLSSELEFEELLYEPIDEEIKGQEFEDIGFASGEIGNEELEKIEENQPISEDSGDDEIINEKIIDEELESEELENEESENKKPENEEPFEISINEEAEVESNKNNNAIDDNNMDDFLDNSEDIEQIIDSIIDVGMAGDVLAVGAITLFGGYGYIRLQSPWQFTHKLIKYHSMFPKAAQSILSKFSLHNHADF
jgi:hypothetical protein